MKKINVISPVYKNKQVNYEGFIVNFNVEGKAVVEVDDKKVEEFKGIIEQYPNVFDADNLPADYGKKKEEKKDESVTESTKVEQTNLKQLEVLKEGNIKLAKENAELKKENAELKAENDALKEKNAALEKELDSFKDTAEETEESEESSEDNKEEESEEKEEEVEQKENEEQEKEDDSDIEKELNSKTVTELKGILNDVYSDFKEEWKKLSKKDEIIDYIKNKSSVK